MKREQVMKSLAVTAFASLVIGSVSPAFVHAEGAKAKKSTWTVEHAPKDTIVEIAPATGKPDDAVKPAAPMTDDSLNDTDRIIVKYKKGFSTTAASILTSSTMKSSSKLADIDATLVKVSVPSDMKQLLEKLNKDPNVLYAEPDRKIYSSGKSEERLQKTIESLAAPSPSLPNDTYFEKQWGLHNTGQTPPWNYNNPYQEGYPGVPGLDIQAPEAWTITKGSAKVVVAVIDTGLQIDHPDLVNSIWTNPGETAGNDQKDNDNNGYADDVHGWNFAENNNSVYKDLDLHSHATAVAGIIAGATDNGIGIAGIAPNVKIMPIKYIGEEYGYLSDLIKAIEFAEDNGAKIADINAGLFDYSQALKDAMQASSMLFVTPAGDYGVNADGIPYYPSSFGLDNVLSVTSIDNEGHLLFDANYGYESIDVAAPGEAIATTAPVENPGLSAELHDPVSGAKAIFNGIGFENILDDEEEDENYRQEAFDKAMEYLGVSKSNAGQKVLLVQDDLSNYTELPSTSKLKKYTDLLEDYPGVEIVQSTPDGGDGPTLAKMQSGYDAVIWFTGMADRWYVSNLTVNDQKNLTDYLNGGGHLLLTGSNVLNGPTEYGGGEESSIIDSPFVKDELHLAFIEQYFYSKAVGVKGTIYEGETYPLDEDKDSYNYLISRDPSITKIDLINITRDFNGSSYTHGRGTAMAAANAAGTAALVLSQEPSLSAQAIKQRIVNSGTQLSSLSGRVASGRMINAYQALSDDEIPGTPLVSDSTTNNLNESTDVNDVYAVELHAGETINFSMTGDKGTDFDLYLYAPNATTVNSTENLLVFSEYDKTSTESINYKVTESGTYYLNAYAYRGSGAYQLSVQTNNQLGGYNDTNKSLVFSGPWAKVNDSMYTEGTKKEINAFGSVEFAFVGSYFSWIGSKNVNQGIADVYLDGSKVASPSLYSKSSLNKQIIFEKSLPLGKHVIQIAWTGERDPAAAKSNKTFINVDAFNVAQLIQDNDYAFKYSGLWATNYSMKHFGGSAKYTTKTGNYAKAKFQGTQVKLYAIVGSDRGMADIYIDDVLVSSGIDMYRAATSYRTAVFESNQLAPGAHTIKIVHAGAKNPLSTGTVISVDAISITK
ncbi:S8 family serine peptidase [Paenibacillus sp. CF384]|uniref:S8 family serine peptidase n=1 Tax=Paenibacillus sp. CF384 TaxID=1884382 RepID=UPI00089BDB78|nr:S8 family serine peptidase [Paenibacillus sp. CF384]SDX73630.1 Subtilase family protein [Paenibacillus sp. CF384]